MIITAADMYVATLEGLKKANTSGVTIEEWNIRINNAQLHVIRNKYGAAVEANQKRIDDLTEITVYDELINNSTPGTAGSETMPVQMFVSSFPYYLYMLDVHFTIQCVKDPLFDDAVKTNVPATPVISDNHGQYSLDPYKQAKVSNPLYRMIASGTDQRRIKPYLGKDSKSWVKSSLIDYLRYPKEIYVNPDGSNTGNKNCELHIDVRTEVVDLCIRELLEAIQSQRFQTNTVRNQETIV